MLQATDTACVKKNDYTQPRELGSASEIEVYWFSSPKPVIELEIGDLLVSLTPRQARILASDMQDAVAKAIAEHRNPRKED